MFEPYNPLPTEQSPKDWVEFHEVLYSQGHLLIRCVPANFLDAGNTAQAVLLDFGRILSLRITEAPFEPELSAHLFALLPKTQGDEQFLLAKDTDWVYQHASYTQAQLYHHLLFAWLDRRVEVLTECREPKVVIEREIHYSVYRPRSFATTSAA